MVITSLINWKLSKSEFGQIFKMIIVSLQIFRNWIFYVQTSLNLSVTICSFTALRKAQSAACIYQLICRSKLWLDWIPLMARIFKIPNELILNHSPEYSVLREFGGVGFFRHVTDINVDDSYQPHVKDQAYLIVLIGSIFEQNRG